MFAASGLTTFFTFQYVWPFHPEAGAALSLVALAAPLVRVGYWSDILGRGADGGSLGRLVALDGVESHAPGVWTALDAP